MPGRTVHVRGVTGELLLPLLERKRLLDTAWIVCLVGGLGPVALLWFMSILEVDVERAAWIVVVYALAYLAVATLCDRLTTPAAMTRAIRATTLTSIVFLGALWHLVGGLDNPMFLLMFTLPVLISGIMMIGRLAHLAALVSVLTVTFVALGESPGLRWYVERFHISVPVVAFLARDAAGSRPFNYLDVGPAYEFTLIATFACLQFIVAFVSTPLTVLLQRINARFETSGRLLTEVQGLFHAVLRAVPEPSVVLYADSGQVVQASDSFFQRMLVKPSQLVGKSIFETVRFADSERVHKAFEARAGDIPFCVYQIGNETRIANVSFHRTEHAGTGYIYVAWQELTELYYLQSAFDAVDDPLVVIGANGLLLYANRTSEQLFGQLHFGMDTAAVPTLRALTTQPSALPLDSTDTNRCEINGIPYSVNRLAAPLPGESGTATILWLHCIAHEEALFQQAVRDPLTGIYNRRYFDEVLHAHIERTKRGQKVALAYFDLDKFKSINDTLGHAAGDRALLTFVAAVKAQLRETDVFARRGGDEFAVIFVDCETDVAAAAIERLRGVLDREGGVYEGTRFEIRFSAGLAACHSGDTVQHLLERADLAVYAAKESGRGRLVVES
jgi:diguanylate cyclase (GGDEF)-like protein